MFIYGIHPFLGLLRVWVCVCAPSQTFKHSLKTNPKKTTNSPDIASDKSMIFKNSKCLCKCLQMFMKPIPTLKTLLNTIITTIHQYIAVQALNSDCSRKPNHFFLSLYTNHRLFLFEPNLHLWSC